jgi:hypothetical protein
MKFFFPDLFERKLKNHHDEHTVAAVHESFHNNITEGSEFLDDAIRMKEQPFMYSYTEESITPGSPKDLW